VLMYRKYKFGYPYRRIYLGNKKWAIVDPDDYYRLVGFKWCAIGQNGTFYAVAGIQVSPEEIKLVRMHRLIMNAPDGVLVDHRNSLSLDNRKTNLRFATHAQNIFNRSKKKLKNASSKFMGVSFRPEKRKWVARIYYQYKQIWLGYFKSEIDAARAYDRAAIKYHGEFARLNFPREDYSYKINTLKHNKDLLKNINDDPMKKPSELSKSNYLTKIKGYGSLYHILPRLIGLIFRFVRWF
jgi:hypothetical protein